eukprot:TRINITY_DN6305_c0_g3_i2.p1 TRINITY_DN6305_c0_g3~~TRINITY_DN6305_c0_g3_i2.p1  ORF type:complete len:219 (+),score=14.97 TRINITY_DN6305_c0_g3_i2:187-843(+)
MLKAAFGVLLNHRKNSTCRKEGVARLVYKIREIVRNQFLFLNSHTKSSSFKISNNIISNQTLIIKCVESDIEKKASEINAANSRLATHLLSHIIKKRLLHTIVSLYSPNQRKLFPIRRSEIGYSVFTKSERQKIAYKPNMSKSTCSSLPSVISVRGDVDPIMDTKENLNQSNSSTENVPQPLEELEEFADDGLNYLLSAEEKVWFLLLLECLVVQAAG